MDFGLCDGNYYDYENDEAAILREFDLAHEVKGEFFLMTENFNRCPA